MRPPTAAEQLVFDVVTPLTFSITGMSKDRQVYVCAGSGFFVAPYTGVTAAHVLRHLWDKLEMPWKQGKYPKNTVEPEFFVAAVQMLDIRNPTVAAHWEITGATPLDFTDIAFLNLVPRDEQSANMRWPRSFPELELLPPARGQEVWAFGYPGGTYQHTAGEAVVDVATEPTLISGVVLDHHEQGRASWQFPQFQVSIPFEPGMSGGPVLHNRNVCGVVSYGPDLEGGARGESYAASVWPVLASDSTSTVDPRMSANPVLDMIQTGSIHARRWQEIQRSIRSKQTADGRQIPELVRR